MYKTGPEWLDSGCQAPAVVSVELEPLLSKRAIGMAEVAMLLIYDGDRRKQAICGGRFLAFLLCFLC
jgi:hypothetical protein